MEEMKPGGTTPVAERPTITSTGGEISLECKTEGASIVYQTPDGEGWSDWKLYVKSFPHTGPLRAQACRLGYRSSEIVQLRQNAE